MHTLEFSRIDYRSQSSISFGTPTGAEASDHLTMNDGRTQSSLTDIIGRANIRSMQAHKQAFSVFLIPSLQQAGFRLGYGAPDQPVTQPLHPFDLSLELIRRQVNSLVMQMDCIPEHGLHRSSPENAGMQIDDGLQIANLVCQAELALFGRSLQLRRTTIADPHFRFMITHDVPDHVRAAIEANYMQYRCQAAKHPFPPVLCIHCQPANKMSANQDSKMSPEPESKCPLTSFGNNLRLPTGVEYECGCGG